eukprot:12086525-Alexandrium_andersonii.AAC.2
MDHEPCVPHGGYIAPWQPTVAANASVTALQHLHLRRGHLHSCSVRLRPHAARYFRFSSAGDMNTSACVASSPCRSAQCAVRTSSAHALMS